MEASGATRIHQTTNIPTGDQAYRFNSPQSACTEHKHPETGHDAQIEVVKPYAIEEPDEERIHESSGPTNRGPSHNLEQSQGDLVDSLDDLHCESDHTDPNSHLPGQKRGKKRKPPTIELGGSQHTSSQRAEIVSHPADAQYKAPSLSPKRPRRRSSGPENEFPSHSPNKAESSINSSSSSKSPGTSSTDSIRETPAINDMDID